MGRRKEGKERDEENKKGIERENKEKGEEREEEKEVPRR